MQLRQLVLATMAAALLATPAAAQKTFEGVLTLKMTPPSESSTPMTMTVWAKGNKTRTVTAGPVPMELITDGPEMIMLMPKEKKYYRMGTAADLQGATADKPLKISRIPGGATIAGIRCENYRFTREGVADSDICVAKGLGSLGGSVIKGNSWAGPKDEKALRATFGDEVFPLRIVDRKTGRTILEVTKVERTSVSDERLAPPAGWTALTIPSGKSGR